MGRALTLILLTFFAVSAMGDVETTTVLPRGVSSPKFIMGTYSNLSERYNSDGLIEGVADQYHLDLTGAALAKLDPQLQQLVTVLNNFSPTERLGDSLTLGTLDFQASPVIDYFAPTYAYGMSENFSIGFGVPVIHYRNTMRVVSTGGNAAELRAYLNNASSDVNDALDKLVAAAGDMTASLNGILAARGYKPFRDVEYTALGDFQISGVYRYYRQRAWRLALRPYIQLPTGRKDDPDDLEDFATGGQPAVGLYSIHEYQLTRDFQLVSAVGYQANIQDTVEKRVPNGSSDFLPGPDRKETVRRLTGNSLYLEGGAAYNFWRPLEARVVYDLTQKDPDWYDGDRGWDYASLSNDTGSQIHAIKASLEFSTVDYFRRKMFSVPFMVGYVFGDTLYAVNAPNQVSHQLYLRMFF